VSDLTASQVLFLLKHPFNLEWSIQGFGMLRAYLASDQIYRLHIWDTEQMSVEDVSTVHDHPWDLDSRIISGTLVNQRYVKAEYTDAPHSEVWNAVLIRTGEGGHPLVDKPERWRLNAEPYEVYEPGERYHQDAPEIHESLPTRGCVTVVKRTFSRQRDIATSLYRNTPEWVSAEPRPATMEEIYHFTNLALANWNDRRPQPSRLRARGATTVPVGRGAAPAGVVRRHRQRQGDRRGSWTPADQRRAGHRRARRVGADGCSSPDGSTPGWMTTRSSWRRCSSASRRRRRSETGSTYLTSRGRRRTITCAAC
jgi:hypothetical protein